ncbi:MAG: CPBP family intramembrane metalloprotease [Patulibacter sp.]
MSLEPSEPQRRQGAAPLHPPGYADAVRATIGVIVAYGGSIVFAALVAAISGAANDGLRSAGDTRAQLAIQAVTFAGAALLLAVGLRLSHRPRERNLLAAAARDRSPAMPPGRVLAIGLLVAGAALLVGPLISALVPGLHNGDAPIDELGLGKGLGADIGTVLVVVGLVPLGEELLFRAVLVGAWVRAERPVLAVVSSALLFGLAHVTVGPRAVAVTVLLGALFAAALLLSGSLGVPVFAHAFVNAIALLNGGLGGPIPVAVLVLTVLAVTVVATRNSRSVVLLPPAGTLTG